MILTVPCRAAQLRAYRWWRVTAQLSGEQLDSWHSSEKSRARTDMWFVAARAAQDERKQAALVSFLHEEQGREFL